MLSISLSISLIIASSEGRSSIGGIDKSSIWKLFFLYEINDNRKFSHITSSKSRFNDPKSESLEPRSVPDNSELRDGAFKLSMMLIN